MKTIVHHHLEAADLLKIVNGEDLEITEANGEKLLLPGFSDRDRHELRELLGFPEDRVGGSSPAPAAAQTKRKYTRRKKIRAKAVSPPKKRKGKKTKAAERQAAAPAAAEAKPGAMKCPGAPNCRKVFYSQAWLDKHIKKTGHGTANGNGSAVQPRTRGWQPGKFDCRPCGASFDTAGELTDHQVAKHGMKVSQSA